MRPLAPACVAAWLAAFQFGVAAAQGVEPGSPPASAADAVPDPDPDPDRAAQARAVAQSSLGACVRRPPVYPVEALRRELQGRNLVTFLVSAEGAPVEPAVLRSSGHPVLDHAALRHLVSCIAQREKVAPEPLPPGRYAFPMVWRLE